MTRRNRRLVFAVTCIALAGAAAGLTLWALRSSATYFYSPTDLVGLPSKPSGRIRIGGLVESGTVSYLGAKEIAFKVTDFKSQIDVRFSGVLPSLFREGQGVVAEGTLSPQGVFLAETILAKHDETYMPPEVAKTLKERGLWQDGTGAPKGNSAGAPGSG